MKPIEYYLSLFCSFLLFLTSGVLSSWIYCMHHEGGGAFFPGLIFTGCAFIIFIFLRIRLGVIESLGYYIGMNIICLAAITLTFLSGFAGFITGIIFAGLGAIGVFMLTNLLISKVRVDTTKLFILGGGSFLVTILFNYLFVEIFDRTFIALFFGLPSNDAILGEAFIFWHVIIGIKLFIELSRRNILPLDDKQI